MCRRRSNLSTLSTVRWLCSTVAFIFGIIPQSHQTCRNPMKRCHRKVNSLISNRIVRSYPRKKHLKVKQTNSYQNKKTETDDKFSDTCALPEVRCK